MSEHGNFDYASTVAAARKGDADSYECLFNETAGNCLAVCRKYFDPEREGGEKLAEETMARTYRDMYDRLQTLSDPEEFPKALLAYARRNCREKLAGQTLSLNAEDYIGVGDGSEPLPPLVSADDCRAEVRESVMLEAAVIEELTLEILGRLTTAQRLILLRWNEDDTIAPEEEPTLRSAFIRTEQEVMELEKEKQMRALDFARSRLSFFNWLLDLYDRFVESSVSKEAFPPIWDAIRQEFYLRNTMELPIVEGEAEEETSAPKKPKRRSFFSTWWGRLLLGLLILILVLAGVVATAGQHTSHAKTVATINAPTVSAGAFPFAFFVEDDERGIEHFHGFNET